MIIYKDFQQGSIEWLQIRLGKVTGSRIKEVMTKDNLPLVDKLIAESVTEEIEEGYVSREMQRGKDLEPFAKAKYAKATGQKVEEVGFIVSKKYPWLGYSPDGLIKTKGLYKKGIEIKCPSTHTHVKYIRQSKLPNEHKYQVLGFFLIAQDLEEVDFISYDDRFSIKPLHIVTVTRSEVETELIELENALVKFNDKFQKYYDSILF
ncbi:MAG TPA: YqaJ viral recombinase family protein [Sphingobacteriaceae bacterium]|nr:YqaJ viral recombinase family protein [Sphingobacteriaceae bacterium]